MNAKYWIDERVHPDGFVIIKAFQRVDEQGHSRMPNELGTWYPKTNWGLKRARRRAWKVIKAHKRRLLKSEKLIAVGISLLWFARVAL